MADRAPPLLGSTAAGPALVSAPFIGMPLNRATLSFQWGFETLAELRTKLTQRIVLSGKNATAYASVNKSRSTQRPRSPQ